MRFAWLQFTERANADDACRFHPGPPIFHERQKGWQCCNKARGRCPKTAPVWTALPQHAWMTLTPRLPRQIVYDFDEFMNIPPCTTGRHNADADAGGYAKSR